MGALAPTILLLLLSQLLSLTVSFLAATSSRSSLLQTKLSESSLLVLLMHFSRTSPSSQTSSNITSQKTLNVLPEMVAVMILSVSMQTVHQRRQVFLSLLTLVTVSCAVPTQMPRSLALSNAPTV